jgi:hypothetical protein
LTVSARQDGVDDHEVRLLASRNLDRLEAVRSLADDPDVRRAREQDDGGLVVSISLDVRSLL